MERRIIVSLLFSLWFPNLAHTQVRSGTIVVFQLKDNQFSIAADSRSILNGAPNDSECKIMALNRNFVGAITGGSGYRNGGDVFDLAKPWNGLEEMRRIAEGEILMPRPSHGATLERIADAWADAVKLDFANTYTAHPGLVIGLAHENQGLLINGIFALADDGIVSLTGRSVVFGQGEMSVVSHDGRDCALPCAAGTIDVFNEMVFQTSPRSKTEYGHFSGPSVLRVFRLVDLARAYDKSGTVGGPIDALELFKDGSIRWFSRKDNCPANWTPQ
jgi:hypothetical protein